MGTREPYLGAAVFRLPQTVPGYRGASVAYGPCIGGP